MFNLAQGRWRKTIGTSAELRSAQAFFFIPALAGPKLAGN
ncbi:hypothetical protein AVDCRST_MAG94-4944 [uncultured Leptolyngbya sp.]|nr:hypothetical protein AVDCRST_MAG94-4944 [uncultured Leptolyngbya sp.]